MSNKQKANNKRAANKTKTSAGNAQIESKYLIASSGREMFRENPEADTAPTS